MIYYLAWLILMIVGLTVSVFLFIWALETGQFSDQVRARYLPLVGESLAAEDVGRSGKGVYSLLMVLLGAVAVFITTFFVAVINR